MPIYTCKCGSKIIRDKKVKNPICFQCKSKKIRELSKKNYAKRNNKSL